MADVFVEENTMSEMADAIRGQTGKSDTMLPSEMPGEIEALPKMMYADDLLQIIDRTIADMELPEKLTVVGDAAFEHCSKLRLNLLPKGLIRIERVGFRGCGSLNTLTFLGTPETIANTAFYECGKLTEINVPWAEGAVANAPWGATKATINYDYQQGE